MAPYYISTKPIPPGAQGPQGALGPQGPQGLAGIPGLAGTQGTQGLAGTVSIGATTVGVPGGSAAVTNTGTSTDAILNFTIPPPPNPITITSVEITDSAGAALDDTALGDGSYVKITGTGFGAGAVAMLGTVSATSTTGISQTELRAQFVGVSAGTYSLFVINTDGSSAVLPNGVTWSDFPAWTTTSLAPVTKTRASSQSIAATGDSAITYTATNIPPGTTLSSAGLLSGNITESSTATTIYTFTAEATDAEFQNTPKTFNLTAGFLRNFTQTDNPNMATATLVSGQRYSLNGYFTDASDKLGSGGESFKAFDKTNASIWHSAGGLTTNPKWISFQYPSAVLLASYAITARPDPTNIWSPFTWTFQGSNDGSSWTTLDSQTGITFTEGQSRTFSEFPVVTAYIYYRLYVTSAAQLGTIPGGDYVIVNELVISTRSAGVVVSNSSFTGDTNHLAVLPSGGHVKIIADSPAFFSNSVAKLGTANLSTTFASSTELRAIVPAAAEGTISPLEITNVDGSVLTNANIARWAPPAWTTASALASVKKGVAFSRTVVATHGAGAVTYAVISGSVPSGATFNTATGVISGNVSGSTDETATLALNALAPTLQTAAREFTLLFYTVLYDFASHTFTNAGVSGRAGPTLGECRAAYSTTWDENSAYFNVTAGIQEWTAPSSGSFRIEAWGAQGTRGGGGGVGVGGLGAQMRGDFVLTKGEVLKILVGQNTGTPTYSGGGGGGSFVVRSPYTTLASIAVIAGGGGGGGGYGGGEGSEKIGVAGVTSTSGTSGVDGLKAGGVDGYGGTSDNTGSGYGGAGGGGFLGNGGTSFEGGPVTNSGGYSFASLGYGGVAGATYGAPGGFGGGGAGSYSAGGGGGYSGGAGDSNPAGSGVAIAGGGGGGSYNNGTNQVNVGGTRSGPGQVTITAL